MRSEDRRKPSLGAVLALRDFRRLLAGVTTSHLGDRFALIATPWLVMRLTGDPLALGFVLALEGGPRALFMLLGRAVTEATRRAPSCLAATLPGSAWPRRWRWPC